jgi:cytochrome c
MSTAPAPPVSSVAPLPVPSTTEPPTFQTLTTKGTTVYFNYCAPCHGSTGQGANGPALLKPGGTLGQSGGAVFFDSNAAAMLDFISYFMPLYAPGSLSHSDYVKVTCYLLIQANQIQPFDVFNESQLKSITLK